MAVAVGDVFGFSLEQNLFAQVIYNTFACRVTAVPPGTTEETWVDNWFLDATGYFNLAPGLRDTILQCQELNVTHVRWHISRVTPNPTQVFLRACTTSNIGDMAGDCETANLAMSISRKGLQAGRRQKGRIAICGIPTTEFAEGQFINAAVTRGNNVGPFLRGSHVRVAGDSVEMGFYNPGGIRVVNGVPTTYLPQFVAVVTTDAKRTVRVQRSRTIGVGR